MTNSLANVVIPYCRFLECQEKHRRIAAELTQQDRPATIDTDVAPVTAEGVHMAGSAAHSNAHIEVDQF